MYGIFGEAVSVGLATTSLPPELYAGADIVKEEDLEAMYIDNPAPEEDTVPGIDIVTEQDIVTGQDISPCRETDPTQDYSGDDLNLRYDITSNTSEVHSSQSISANGPSHHYRITPDISMPQSITDMPADDIHYINTDMSEIDTGTCSICENELGSLALVCIICYKVIHSHCADNDTCRRCIKSNNHVNKRKLVQVSQEKQAKKMLKSSESRLDPLVVGDNVRVPVPKVDRGRCDPAHLIGVITNVTEHGNYRIGTSVGNLKGTFARNQVDKCKQVFVSQENVPESVLSVRSAASNSSVSSGQGFVKCNCKTGCFNDRCNCKKKKQILCNSRCHHSLSCKNK